jgi:hypothetical protein
MLEREAKHAFMARVQPVRHTWLRRPAIYLSAFVACLVLCNLLVDVAHAAGLAPELGPRISTA